MSGSEDKLHGEAAATGAGGRAGLSANRSPSSATALGLGERVPPGATPDRSSLPLVEELSPAPDVFAVLQAFCDRSVRTPVVALESTLVREPLGRYSFVCADPFAVFQRQAAEYGADPFSDVRRYGSRFHALGVPGLPPFQGGAVGVLGYELGGSWERVPQARFDEFRLPVLTVAFYDWVLAWDHLSGRCWLVSQGFPERDVRRRQRRAAWRVRWVRERLSRAGRGGPAAGKPEATAGGKASRGLFVSATALPPERLAPHWPVPRLPGVFSDFRRDDYLRMVERVVESIRAGDIFQANVSQRLLVRWPRSPLDLYERLRRCNPAPFAAFFGHRDWAVVSASPERFLRVESDRVETRPVKGTRPRGDTAEADRRLRAELLQSPKDVAENVMIVDLLRNDLSRVCRPGTVRATELCRVEAFETVQHLVSVVEGRLRDECDVWDLWAATFPGGSVTGAPKVRTMEIIAEQEPTVRGPYCGSLFFLSFDGRLDSSILIRTFVCRAGWAQCSVGGGVVAQSDPRSEYDETLHKAEGMLRAVR